MKSSRSPRYPGRVQDPASGPLPDGVEGAIVMEQEDIVLDCRGDQAVFSRATRFGTWRREDVTPPRWPTVLNQARRPLAVGFRLQRIDHVAESE